VSVANKQALASIIRKYSLSGVKARKTI